MADEFPQRFGDYLLLEPIGAGVMAAPLLKPYVAGQMMRGTQDYGESRRPQFYKRFDQHIAPPTLGESVLMGGERVGRKAMATGRTIAKAQPFQTARDILSRGAGYMKSNLVG